MLSFILAVTVIAFAHAQPNENDATSLESVVYRSAVFTQFDVFGVSLRVYKVEDVAGHGNTGRYFFESRPFAVCNATCGFWNRRARRDDPRHVDLFIKFHWRPQEVQDAAVKAVRAHLRDASADVIVSPLPVTRFEFFFEEPSTPLDATAKLPPFAWFRNNVAMGAAQPVFDIGWTVAKADVEKFITAMSLRRLEFRAPFAANSATANTVEVEVSAEQRAAIAGQLFGNATAALVMRTDAIKVLRRAAMNLAVRASIEQPGQFSFEILDFLMRETLGARELLTPDNIRNINAHTIDPSDLACDKIQAKLDRHFEKHLSIDQSQRSQSDFDASGASLSIDGLLGFDSSDSSSSSSSSNDLKQRFNEHDIVVEWTGTKYECKNVYARRRGTAFESGTSNSKIIVTYLKAGKFVLSGQVVMNEACSHIGCSEQCDETGQCEFVRAAPPLHNSDIDEINRKIDALLPMGTIVMRGDTKLPKCWELCDGVNGRPDMRGRFAIGANGDFDVGSQGGSEKSSVVLQQDQIPPHVHRYRDTVYRDVFHARDAGAQFAGTSLYGASAHDNDNSDWFFDRQTYPDARNAEPVVFTTMPPYSVIRYIIKVC